MGETGCSCAWSKPASFNNGDQSKLVGAPVIELVGGGTQAQETRAVDEAAVRENVKFMEDGWNTRSGALFAKPFAEDADYVVINGMQLKGHEAIATGHQRIFDTIYKDTSLKLAVKQIRFLRADVAIVHVNAQREGPAREQMQEAIITIVMTKEKQSWTIAAFQNTGVAPRQ